MRVAHRQLNYAVERCYRRKPFESDDKRMEYLFKLNEPMIDEEKSRTKIVNDLLMDFDLESKK